MFPNKPKIKRTVYLDHAAATPVDKEVKKIMDPYFCKLYGNPSGIYEMGRIINNTLNDSREKIAGILRAFSDDIIFTSGGTESDNLAIFGTVIGFIRERNAGADQATADNIGFCNYAKNCHIITTKIEHPAVLNACKFLEEAGVSVTYLDVDSEGFVDTKIIKSALRNETILVSIMYANNEIGAVQPISDIGRLILKWRKENNTRYPYFHTDACQASGSLDLNVEKLHVDLMSINGSKMYGPKGIGILYKRRGVKIEPVARGGSQEFGLRSGTENVPGIVGIAKALELAQSNRDKENKRLLRLREYFWNELKRKIPKLRLNGPSCLDDANLRLPNNLNVTFMDIEGEALLLYLDEYGIVCSTGSACNSMSLEPSYVITAIGLPYEYAHGSLRFSLGKSTRKQDIDYVMRFLPGIVEKLRKISPVNLIQ